MKTFWKALGLTALAAAVLPYRVRREEEAVTNIDALLWQAVRRPGQEGQLDITIGFKSPLQEIRQERALFTDDPEEAVLFADGQPQAAPADAPAPAEEPEATEEDFDPDL